MDTESERNEVNSNNDDPNNQCPDAETPAAKSTLFSELRSELSSRSTIISLFDKQSRGSGSPGDTMHQMAIQRNQAHNARRLSQNDRNAEFLVPAAFFDNDEEEEESSRPMKTEPFHKRLSNSSSSPFNKCRQPNDTKMLSTNPRSWHSSNSSVALSSDHANKPTQNSSLDRVQVSKNYRKLYVVPRKKSHNSILRVGGSLTSRYRRQNQMRESQSRILASNSLLSAASSVSNGALVNSVTIQDSTRPMGVSFMDEEDDLESTDSCGELNTQRQTLSSSSQHCPLVGFMVLENSPPSRLTKNPAKQQTKDGSRRC